MTTSSKPKGLDPRLERLTKRSTEELPVLQWRSSIVAEVLEAPEVRVLVLLGNESDALVLSQFSPSKLHDRLYAATVPVASLRDLALDPRVVFVEAGRQIGADLDSSAIEVRANQVWPHPPQPGFDGADVVVGIIDFGFDYTLNDFRDAAGNTRVKFLWDQSLVPTPAEHSPGAFPYGVEYDSTAINTALAAANPFALVRHQPGAGAHGTHVAGTAAGNGRSAGPGFPAGTHVGMAPNADIIFVQPQTSDGDATFTDSVHVAEAVAYVFQKARELGKACVVNMSLGQNGGSHDGESVVERAIDAMTAEDGRAFVVAAGNEHVWRGHTSGTLVVGQTIALTWVMGGGINLGGGALPTGLDRTPNEMEIWYSSVDEIEVTVVTPNGDRIGPVAPSDQEIETLPNGVSVFIDHERFTRLNGDALAYIEVSPPANGAIPPGTWTVEIQPARVRDGRIDAWIERDVRDSGNAFADQSFFGGASFVPNMTLGTPATCRRGIAVANYQHAAVPQTVSASSSRGPTRGGRRKPEVAAPGTNIVASGSLGGRPAPNGSIHPVRVRMSGTSMAAPHVTGVVALMFQKNKRLTAAQISGVLRASARPAPGQATPFDESWGYGQLDAKAALDLTP